MKNNILKILKLKNNEKVSLRMRNACLLNDAMKMANISKNDLAKLTNRDVSEVELWLSGTYDMDNIMFNNILSTICFHEIKENNTNEN